MLKTIVAFLHLFFWVRPTFQLIVWWEIFFFRVDCRFSLTSSKETQFTSELLARFKALSLNSQAHSIFQPLCACWMLAFSTFFFAECSLNYHHHLGLSTTVNMRSLLGPEIYFEIFKKILELKWRTFKARIYYTRNCEPIFCSESFSNARYNTGKFCPIFL